MMRGKIPSKHSQLRVIKQTEAEPGKKGKTNLKFLVGNMAKDKFIKNGAQGGPSLHISDIQKLKQQLSVIYESIVLIKKNDMNYAKEINDTVPSPKYTFLFNTKFSPDFMQTFTATLSGDVIKDKFVVLASANTHNPWEGEVFITGPKEDCIALIPEMIKILEAEGSFINGAYQGKIGNVVGLVQCKKLLKDYFKNV